MAFPTKIPLFRRFVLQNFPFIEQDFDALTDYQLICKVVEYLNKVIEVTNETTGQVELLTTAFNQLKDYVDNYFDNLDVQEEINNKLDAMVEDGTLPEIIDSYIQTNVTWTFDTVADMKASTNLINGSYAKTLGYYTVNDGGSALYKITNTSSASDYQESLNSGLYATLIVPNGILNVKTVGVKSDASFDNTSAFNTALSYSNKYAIYIPYGFYRTSYLNSLTTNTDIKIYGDNATIKLLDNVITADNQRLFAFSCANDIDIVIEMYGLNIDMNYTNNNSVVISSGDPFALQHCHAIYVLGSANSNINVLFHDITFNDLIADGINLGGSSTKIVNNAIINNIISQNRTAKRSDVCITADFDSLNCSDMILDKFEIETNSVRSNTNRTIVLNNLDLKDTLDLDIVNNDGGNVGYINNVRVGSYFYNSIENATYTNCTFTLSRFIRINGKKVQFINCDFYTKDNTNFETPDSSTFCYINTTTNYTDLRFKNCNIKYNNAVLSNTADTIAMFLRASDAYAKIELDNCVFDISSNLLQYRSGNTNINNCTIHTNNEYVTVFCVCGTSNATSNIYLTNNKTSNDIYLYQPSTAGSAVTIYENNPEWAIGKVLNWTRFDKITAFNGGSGSIVTVKEFTEFMNNDVPNAGKWIKGQRVINSIPSTNFMWVCTATGSFESGTAPTFSAIAIS